MIESESTDNCDSAARRAQLAALIVGLLIVVPIEVQRFRAALASEAGAPGWLFHWNIDTTIPGLMLLLLPLCWRRRKSARGQEVSAEIGSRSGTRLSGIASAVLIGCISFGLSWSIAGCVVRAQQPQRLGDLPPAYHDEYAYLFQAETLLQGRFHSPSHAATPALFDQIHVLNEGRMASRYYPGTGAWMAPFVSVGRPIIGHWIAGALAAALMFLTAREIGGTLCGWIAGLLTSMSPGIGIFSNLLLAHHPTLLGLSVFLWAMVRLFRTASARSAFIAGCGLSFAMLCRPMTAAAFALPFGLWMLWRIVRGGFGTVDVAPASRMRVVAAMAIPLLAGISVMYAYNRSITGDGLKMPYQLYTDLYSPNHVYGFHNVTRGSQVNAPKRLQNYDSWARELTPQLAANNVRHRAVASLQWTLALVPLAMAVVAGLFLVRTETIPFRLCLAALLSLHVAHIPYWYDGIMHWHYVFESCVLLTMIAAVVASRLYGSAMVDQ